MTHPNQEGPEEDHGENEWTEIKAAAISVAIVVLIFGLLTWLVFVPETSIDFIEHGERFLLFQDY